MADLPANIFTAPQGGMDAGLLALANQNKGNDNSGVNSIMPIAGLALLMRTMFPVTDPALAANAALNHNQGATVNEVQGIVNGINTIQDIGAVRREVSEVSKEVWQAEAAIQRDIAATAAASAAAALNAQIANLQGQGLLAASIAENRYVMANEVHESAADTIANANMNAANSLASMNMLAAALNQGNASLAASIADAKYDTTITVMNDGDKTRTAIAALAASLPNARELDLQRQLAVAQDLAFESRLNHRVDSGNVTVTTNVNQAQAQQQQQQQVLREIDNLRREMQVNTQSTIAIGSTLTGNAQTATNVRQ